MQNLKNYVVKQKNNKIRIKIEHEFRMEKTNWYFFIKNYYIRVIFVKNVYVYIKKLKLKIEKIMN